MCGIMYTPFQLGNIEISNRFVASAMFEYGANNGHITEKIKERYLKLADGGAGLIITGMQAVCTAGSIGPIMVNTEYNGYIKDIKDIVNSVHERGAKLIVQLQHCGNKTGQSREYDKFDVCERKISNECIYHSATKDDLKKVINDFATSALKCKEAGVDGVQIHGAHGFLINSFLSPSTNRRIDEYGGKIENRARLLFEIYTSIRQIVGSDFIIGIKFPFSDLNKNSIKPDESIWVCKELESHGIDFIEVSSGMIMDNSTASFIPLIRNTDQAPFLKYASLLAENIKIPVISVCGYHTLEMAENALKETKIKAISFRLSFVREPNLPNRWKEDNSRAKCIYCNSCCNSFDDKIITCQIEKR